MAKILGVDYGERRTGVAISDDSRTIAFPRETLDCPRTVRTNEFLAELAKRTAIPLKKWDERLSTKIAEAVLIEAGTSREKRRGVVDKLAAQVILQGYLDATAGAAEDDAP